MADQPTQAELDSQLERILRAAIKVAASAPAKPGQYVSHAKIYWPHIQELREALLAGDLDWRPSPEPPEDEAQRITEVFDEARAEMDRGL